MRWHDILAERIDAVGRSDVAAVLALAERPDVVSLAGGLPDPRTFLLDEVREVADAVLREVGAAALGYSPVPGVAAFRESIAARMTAAGRPTEPGQVLVTTGGIAALDLIAKSALNPGDAVIVGEPTYLAALHVFKSYQARLVGVPVDADGMDPDALAERLETLADAGVRPKLLYLVPSFQNPTGVTLPETRRRRILDLARAREIAVIEDAAYRALRFEGEAPPLMAALAPDAVLYIDTFSKVFNPGVRLGWAVAPAPVIETLITAKQGQDQCTSALAQHVCRGYIDRGFLDRQVERARALYRDKRDALLAALDAHMPDGVSWTHPEGGFYSWVTCPERVDTDALLGRAIAEERVAYVPGRAFYHDGTGQNHLRLCYSYVTNADIEPGIARLAAVLGRALR
jgi:2-aminoadipate transaminase